MEISRREFLKLCGLSGLTLGLSQSLLTEVVKALEEAAAGSPPVLWLHGSSDSGCSVSLLNSVHPSIAEVLLQLISLEFHQTVMAASGEMATSALEEALESQTGEFILVVEGAIPTGINGVYCTVGELEGIPMMIVDWVKMLGAKAKAVVAVGTCASFGGIPAAAPNPTECKNVGEIFQENGITTPLINIPGCPPHPDWIVGTLFHVLRYGIPDLDTLGRPRLFFGKLVHDKCPERSHYDNREFAYKPGESGCRLLLGCRGPDAYADCPTRLWNGGVNWCVESGAACIGCTHPGFPDSVSPFYLYG
jgi:hydrogenase small subunit